MPRLFSGITLPDPIAAQLHLLQSGLKNAHWIDPSNFHITLRFLGDVDDLFGAEYDALLKQIDFQPFCLKLKGVGSFGGRKPRILWAGVEDLTGGLLALHQQHERAAIALGLESDHRNYAPHITLLRPRHIQPGKVAQYLQYQGQFETPPFLVSEFMLFSARPGFGGGPYLIEESYPKSLEQQRDEAVLYAEETEVVPKKYRTG